MDDETAATTAQEPGATQGFEAAAEAAAKTAEPAATQEGAVTGEGTEEPKVPSTIEEFLASERHLDALAGARTAAVEEATPNIHRDAKSAAMREFDSSYQRTEANMGNLAKSGQGMSRSLRDAVDGLVEAGGDARQLQRGLQRVIDDNPGFIDMVNSAMFGQGQDSTLRKLAAESGDPNLMSDMYIKLQNDPGMGDVGFAREMLDRLTEARMDSRVKEAVGKALTPKDEEITRLTAELNRLKGQVRTDGPTTLPGSAGGGNRYAEMTAEERAKLTNEERDRAVAAQLNR